MDTKSKALFLLLLVTTDHFTIISKVKADREARKNARQHKSRSDRSDGFDRSDGLASEYQMMEEDESESPPAVDLFISEVNLDTSNGINGKFIELLMVEYRRDISSLKNKLAGFFLLLLQGSPLELVMSIPISDFVTEVSGVYIVFGDSVVPNLNVDINGPKIPKSYQDTFPDMDNCPFAFIICYSQDIVFQDSITLRKEGQKYSSIPLSNNEHLQTAVFKFSMDAIVVGRKAPTNQCDFFSSFFPGIMMSPKKKYILRDWDSKVSPLTDFSLNYCCDEKISFSPSCFKLGSESPGADNDCNKRRFILEFEITTMAVQDATPSATERIIEGCDADFPGVSASKYARVQEGDYSNAVRRVMSTPECAISNYEEGFREFATYEDSRTEKPTTEQPETTPKKYIEEFDRSSFKKCKDIFSNYLEVLTPEFQSWVQVSRDGTCVIKCRICQTYFSAGWRVDKKSRSVFQTKGHSSSDPSVTQRAIRRHLTDVIHKEAAQFYTKLSNAATRAEQIEIEETQKQYEVQLFRPTMNEVQLGYTELRSRSSFRSHKMFMDAVSSMGVNVGTKHRHDGALQKIASVLSTSFHKRLLQHLVENDKWFSIICDGTCNRQIPYFVCLFQSIENNRPMVYLWRLIALTDGEVGENMVNDLKSKIEEDSRIVPGFKEYFKSRLVASVSDGASNMVGNKNSFYTHLRDYAGRPLVMVKCLPHRLQRAVIHAINFPTDHSSSSEKERKRYFKDFSKINNQVYTFYMSRGSKRFQNLVELGRELDIPTYRINYFFDIRWAASHKRCMESLYKNYDVIRADLDRITSDPLFDDSSKSKALELKGHFSDKTFPLVVAEFVDLLMVIEKMSLRFQQKGGIMIGNVEIIKDGYDKLGLLAQNPGAFLSEFLSKCACPGVCATGKCTLLQYDQCIQVQRGSSQALSSRTDGIHTIFLSKFRSTLYVSMQQQLEAYFEFERMEAFEVFNHKYFKKVCELGKPISCDAMSDCYDALPSIGSRSSVRTPDEKLSYICKHYNVPDCDGLTKQWKALMEKFLSDSSLISKTDDAVEFWSYQLSRTDIGIGNVVRDVIERIMATAFTSADAERAFSIVSSIKTPDRSNLSPVTLESLVRIQFNGPDTLRESRLFEYTKEYVKLTSRVDDNSRIHGGSVKSTDSHKYTLKSDIF